MRRRRGGVARAAPLATGRNALIAAVGLLAAVLVTVPTVGAIYARSAPTLALAFWPWRADAAATLAAGLVSGELGDGSPVAMRVDRARRLAARALDREPVQALAAAVAGVADIARGREADGRRALTYAEALSRRELVTELALIQDAVSRGDVAGALTHYDRALRTSARAPGALFPVLVPAADQPAVTGPLARLLAGRPGWWLPFSLQYAQRSRAPAALAAILAAERLRPGAPTEAAVAVTGMKRLVALGRVDLAARLDARWSGPRRGLLADGDFARAAPLPPFDWDVGAGDDAPGAIEDVDGGRALLLTVHEGGVAGVAARQLVRLPAGRYRLSARTRGLSPEGARPVLSISCVDGRKLPGAAAGAAAGDSREDALVFDAPAGCPGEWVEIGAVPGTDASAPPPTVRAVRLEPAPREG